MDSEVVCPYCDYRHLPAGSRWCAMCKRRLPAFQLADKIIPYQELIDKSTEGFVGRQWVRDEVDRFLARSEPRHFLLLGEPGCGKTSFMADLTQRLGYPHHFIGKGSLSGLATSLDWRDPIRFAESIGYQLVRDYGGWIIDWESWGIQVKQEVVQEVRDLQGLLIGSAVEEFDAVPRPASRPVLTVAQEVEQFGAAARVVGVYIENFRIQPEQVVRQLLTVPLTRIAQRWPEHQVVLVVDGLDEAEGYSDPGRNILHLLPDGSLPSNVRFLLSSRPGMHLSHDFLERVQSFWLSEDLEGDRHPGAMEDAKAYIMQLAREETIRAMMASRDQEAELLGDKVAEASRGNFLYLYHYAQGLRGGDASLLDLAALPEGLHGIYRDFLAKVRDGVDDVVYWDQTCKPVLGALAVAREPLQQEQIADLSGVGENSVGTILAHVRQFLEPVGAGQDNRYKLYHPSFGEYLISSENRDHISGREAHARVVNHYRQGARTWDKVDWSEVGDYGLRHLPAHLALASKRREVKDLLTDFRWLQAKLGVMHVRAVLQDYDHVPDETEPRLVHEAIKRSAQVLQQDQAQFAGQLLGRLLARDEPAIRNLLAGAAQWRGASWLRPLVPSLIPPGDPLLFTLAGHEGTVRSMAITPDGRWGITAGNSHPDRTVRLWDLGAGTQVHTLADQAEDGGYNPVGLTADGRWALVARDANIHVWNVVTGEQESVLRGHGGRITALAVVPGMQGAISAADDGSLLLWDLLTRQKEELQPAREDAELIYEVAVSPDGSHAAILSANGIQYWDLECRQPKAELPLENAPFSWSDRSPLAVPRTGYRVFFGSPLRIWDVEAESSKPALPSHAPRQVLAVAPDGQGGGVAFLTPDKETLEVWDIEEGACRTILPTQRSEIAALTLTPNGRTAAVAQFDHYLKVWALEFTATSAARTARGDAVTVAPDGDWAAASEKGDLVQAWDFNTGDPLSEPASRDAVEQALRIAQSEHSGWVRNAYYVIKRQTERDSGRALSGEELSGRLSPTPVRATRHQPGGFVMASRELKPVVAAVNDRQAITYVPERHKTSEVEEKAPPAPRYVLSLWDLTVRDSEPMELMGHSLPVEAVAMTHDGRLAVSAGRGRVVRVWDLEVGQELQTLRGHRGWVYDLQLTPDGRYVVSASEDRTVRFWDLERRECVAVYTSDLPMRSCAVSDDGHAIAGRDLLGRIHLLRLESPV